MINFLKLYQLGGFKQPDWYKRILGLSEGNMNPYDPYQQLQYSNLLSQNNILSNNQLYQKEINGTNYIGKDFQDVSAFSNRFGKQGETYSFDDTIRLNQVKDDYNKQYSQNTLVTGASAFNLIRGQKEFDSKPKDNFLVTSGNKGYKYFQFGGQPNPSGIKLKAFNYLSNKINKKFVNKTGYTVGSDTYKNPMNIIPSSNITMKNTDIPLLAKADNSNKIHLLEPGNDYNFNGAKYVTEIPAFQNGGEINNIEKQFGKPIRSTFNDQMFTLNELPKLVERKNKEKSLSSSNSNNKEKDLSPDSVDVKKEIDRLKKKYGYNNNQNDYNDSFGSNNKNVYKPIIKLDLQNITKIGKNSNRMPSGVTKRLDVKQNIENTDKKYFRDDNTIKKDATNLINSIYINDNIEYKKINLPKSYNNSDFRTKVDPVPVKSEFKDFKFDSKNSPNDYDLKIKPKKLLKPYLRTKYSYDIQIPTIHKKLFKKLNINTAKDVITIKHKLRELYNKGKIKYNPQDIDNPSLSKHLIQVLYKYSN